MNVKGMISFREALLVRIYEAAEGRLHERVKPTDFAEELRTEKERIYDAIVLMKKQGLIDTITLDGSLSLSPFGIQEAERLILEKERMEMEQNSQRTSVAMKATTVEIFICHSEADVEIAKRLVALIRSAFNIETKKIRCTSVDNFRLEAGTPVDGRLRIEILESKTFIALITPNSIRSVYVLFELGARWGAKKPLLPLIAQGKARELLKGPLAAFSALSCDSEQQMLQFVEDLGKELGRQSDSPAAYSKCIREVVEGATQKTSQVSAVGIEMESARLAQGDERFDLRYRAYGLDIVGSRIDSIEEKCNTTLNSIIEKLAPRMFDGPKTEAFIRRVLIEHVTEDAVRHNRGIEIPRRNAAVQRLEYDIDEDDFQRIKFRLSESSLMRMSEGKWIITPLGESVVRQLMAVHLEEALGTDKDTVRYD